MSGSECGQRGEGSNGVEHERYLSFCKIKYNFTLYRNYCSDYNNNGRNGGSKQVDFANNGKSLKTESY